MVTGHNRIYYHTRTSQPVRACEFDVDSEAEDAPVWLRQHYQRKVEEFTDVNPVSVFSHFLSMYFQSVFCLIPS